MWGWLILKENGLEDARKKNKEKPINRYWFCCNVNVITSQQYFNSGELVESYDLVKTKWYI